MVAAAEDILIGNLDSSVQDYIQEIESLPRDELPSCEAMVVGLSTIGYELMEKIEDEFSADPKGKELVTEFVKVAFQTTAEVRITDEDVLAGKDVVHGKILKSGISYGIIAGMVFSQGLDSE